MSTTKWARACCYLIAVILPAFLFAQETPAPPAGTAAQQVEGAAAPVGGEKALSLTPTPEGGAKTVGRLTEVTPTAEGRSLGEPAEGQSPAEGPEQSRGKPAEGRVTFNLKDADLHDILRTFSLRYGVVIVADAGVRGKVTVSLADVPWETALNRIVESCGYSYVKEGKVYRVIPRPLLGAGSAGISAGSSGMATPLPAGAATPLPQPSAETGVIEEAPPSQATPVGGALPPGSPPGEARPPVTPAPLAGVEPAPGAPAEGRMPAGKFPSAPGRVTFDFKDADIVNILRIFSTRYGINIVAGPEVQGKVTIRLVDVPWETALKLILESNNYSYVKQNNVVRVISRDQLDKEPLETQVFPLSYARATEVINSVAHLLTPARGQIKPDDRSNTLVVTDTPGRLTQIEAIISRLDRRTPQVLIESRILELKDDFDENIGINWVSLKGYSVTFGPPKDEGMFSIKREQVKTKLDSTDRTYTDKDTLTRTTEKTSDRSKQTGPSGSTTTTTISTVPGTDSGTTITTTSGSTATTTRGSTSDEKHEFIDGYDALGMDNRGNQVTTTELTQAVLTPNNFQLTLNFLQEQTDANLISHPKLVTADNKESTIKVTEQWPIPKFSLNSQTGQYDITDFEYKDIGIVLKVKPHVNEDDFINMSVTPEVSDIIGKVTFGGAIGAELPLIQTRTATTDVLIKNGQTLAIGGLMREDESDNISKVPLFGEIPLIGPYIFTNSSKVIFNRNLIIFITANVVTEENKDSLWLGQREDEARRLNLPRSKWWEPKKLRHGLGSKPGY